MTQELSGIRVVTLAVNVPGPVAAARLCALGAQVHKIEGPAGDTLRTVTPSWYDAWHRDRRSLQSTSRPMLAVRCSKRNWTRLTY